MGSASTDEREVRAARNRAILRAVNEKILELNEAFGALLGTFAIACECAAGKPFPIGSDDGAGSA